ncbi:fimbrial protein [Haemophilus haemolyticus]|uniref:Fimbrial protein n=1 Tax=Haemophilus haemolyticus TaxID=726 RepID=A0A852PZ53_HAEHA|nr:fimbrial protein [Haemophilus haemolyticus]NYA27663.1 fimbrial protein [Haemophilus haemolyticus]
MNKSVYKIATTILLMLGMRETFASCAQIDSSGKVENPMVYHVVGNNDASLELKTQYFSQDQEEFISEWFSTAESNTACFDLSRFSNTSNSLPPFTITMKLVMQGNLTSTGRTYDGYTIYKLNNSNLGLIFEAIMRSGSQKFSSVKVNSQETVIGQNQVKFSQSTGSFGAIVRARYILLNKPTSGTSYTIPAINETIFKIKTESNTVKSTKYPYRDYILKDDHGTFVNLSTNGLVISNPIKSCLINGGSDQTIPLREIYKREIDPTASGSTGSLEARGGNFSLDVDCTGKNNKEGNQLKPPKVFVTFNGQNGTTNNGNNDLLNIQTGTGKAKGVSLRLKQHDNNTSIKFGKKFQMADATGSGYSRNNFDVYYVNNQSVPVAGGEVKAATTFTLYYQ